MASPIIYASAELLKILSPLPPLSSFSDGGPNAPRGKAAPPSRDAQASNGESRKRPRHAQPADRCAATGAAQGLLPPEVAQAVDAVRRAGAPADTLFFPSLSSEFDTEDGLRVVLGTSVRELKLLRPHGKRPLAWATFFNEADAVAKLVALRRDHPALRPRIHTPRAGGGTAGPGANAVAGALSGAQAASARETFNGRADKIVAEGGVADTIMLRGLPLEVTVEELSATVADLHGACRPVRTRTSEGKSGKVRNFWLSYGDRAAAFAAFQHMHGRSAKFLCGKQQRLVPVVHNDATDAESKTRRGREAAIVETAFVQDIGGSRIPTSTSLQVMRGRVGRDDVDDDGSLQAGAVDLLETFLREDPRKLVFLSKKSYV